MGCSFCRLYKSGVVEAAENGQWNLCDDISEVRKKYIKDQTVDANCSISQLELRAFLDSPIALRHLHKYASMSAEDSVSLIHLWLECRQWLEVNEHRHSCLVQLLKKYQTTTFLSNNVEGIVATNPISDLLLDLDKDTGAGESSAIDDGAAAEDTQLENNVFNKLQKLCFDQLFVAIYTPFSKTEAYETLCKLIGDPDNWVTADSFEYGHVIARGTFGMVVHCRKKSTGRTFAMKIQLKSNMLKYYVKNKHRVMTEMQAYCELDHPYVTKLAYAIQTSTLAMLVLPLSRCGDLERSMRMAVGGRFCEERTLFYLAEITSALSYLHSFGVIYRDLKLANVLLNEDGHIVLADFGSLADVQGVLKDQFKSHHEDMSNNCRDRSGTEHRITHSNPGTFEGSSPYANNTFGSMSIDNSTGTGTGSGTVSSAVIATLYCRESGRGGYAVTFSPSSTPYPGPSPGPAANASPSPNVNPSPGAGSDLVEEGSVNSSVVSRAKSLVGTSEYMAPEIICMFGKRRLHGDGYTTAVDWWALGVMAYQMTTGHLPYARVRYNRLHAIMPTALSEVGRKYQDIFCEIFGEVDYTDEQLSGPAIEVIKGLLAFDSAERWTDRQLRGHRYFERINWSLLEQKKVDAPYLPREEFLPEEEWITGSDKNDPSAASSSSNSAVGNNNNADDGGGTKHSSHCHSNLRELLLHIKQPDWIDGYHDVVYEPPSSKLGTIASLIQSVSQSVAKSIPVSRAGSRASSTISVQDIDLASAGPSSAHRRRSNVPAVPARQPRDAARFKVDDADQMFFYNWNYVDPSLVEGITEGPVGSRKISTLSSSRITSRSRYGTDGSSVSFSTDISRPRAPNRIHW